MDILPSVGIFRELQDIHDTGYFSAQPSLDDHWQQVIYYLIYNLHAIHVLKTILEFILNQEQPIGGTNAKNFTKYKGSV